MVAKYTPTINNFDSYFVISVSGNFKKNTDTRYQTNDYLTKGFQWDAVELRDLGMFGARHAVANCQLLLQ